jgi:hypothetical protein
VDLIKFVLPSPSWGFDSGNQTRSSRRPERNRVERDSALCELLNGDVGNLSHLVLRPNRMLIVCVPKNKVYTHTIHKMYIV